MKFIAFFIIPYLLVSVHCYSQVSFKTEYLGTSSYWHQISDDYREKVSDNRGSAIVYQGNINLPLSMKTNDNNQPIIWGISIGGAYAELNNKNFSDDMISEIINLQFGLFHIRPLNANWSIMSGLGGGIYTSFTDFSKIRYKNILGSVGVIFIRQLRPNLEIGGGLAINSTFGYPMAFPAIYFKWSYESNFALSVSIMSGLEITAGYDLGKHFSLNLIAEMNGQMSLLEKDNKDVIFTHQYIVAGLRPEIKLGKSFSIPLTIGINAVRPAYFSDRSLKGMFNYDEYYFGASFYASAGISFGFKK